MALVAAFSGNYTDDVDTAKGSEVLADLELLRSEINGNLQDVNIKSGAAIAQSKIDGLGTSLALKANVDDPSFTGAMTINDASPGITFQKSGVTKMHVDSNGVVYVDTIAEQTGAAGVTIDTNTLIKDGSLTLKGSGDRQIYKDEDTHRLMLSGGSAVSPANSALLYLYGEGHASAGDCILEAGNSGDLYLRIGNSPHLTIDNSGTLTLTGASTVIGTLTVTSTVNGRNVAVDGTKLDSAHQGENHTGDVTSSGLATTIANNAVTYAKMQNIAANNVLLGNDNGTNQDPQELSAAAVRTLLNVENGATADQSASELRVGAFSGWNFQAAYLAITATSATADGYLDLTAAGVPDNAIAILSVYCKCGSGPGKSAGATFYSASGGDSYGSVLTQWATVDSSQNLWGFIMVPTDSSARTWINWNIGTGCETRIYVTGWIAPS